jgi:cytoskeletal protein CcmA (bactofilin family)
MEERRKSCWISGAITVTGNVTSAGDLVIDGRVEGAIEIAVLGGKVDTGDRK